MNNVSKQIIIKPGMGPDTKLVFSGEGHQRVGKAPSDLIIGFR